MGDLLKNIVTFGAHGRVENKLREFNEIKCKLEAQIEELNTSKKIVNKKIKHLIKTKKKSVKVLKRIQKISKYLTPKDRQYSAVQYEKTSIQDNLIRAEHTISMAEIAMSATKGVSAGVSTALGAWALVAGYGAASTGTAIGALSGVAATNATLAWFGGGAVAAGGGGMAAGTMVLGGIVVVPALIVAAIFSHVSANKKIREIEEQMLEVVKMIEQYCKAKLAIELIGSRTEELTISLKKAQKAFIVSYKISARKIYPIPILSRIVKWLKKKFGYNYYTENDLHEIAQLGKIAKDFAAIIDTKIIDNDGRLI